jgi:hypothetical protein
MLNYNQNSDSLQFVAMVDHLILELQDLEV